jgi:hypothetical protein
MLEIKIDELIHWDFKVIDGSFHRKLRRKSLNDMVRAVTVAAGPGTGHRLALSLTI